MVNNDYDIVKLAENEWLTHSLYVLSDRAIPSMIDGLKPSQRFYVYASLKLTKDDFEKIDSVAGSLSKFGYAHGSTSGAGAAQLMAANWYTIVPLIEGEGSFGSRLIQVPGAPRYTKTKIHKNFNKYFQDINLAPAHPDPEISIPRYYVPVIPYVLLNGTSGMATGFATNIIAREEKDVVKACKEYVSTGKIKTNLRHKFANFSGEIKIDEEGRVVQYGKFEKNGKNSILITEVPYTTSKTRYDREMYIEILDKLEEAGKISSYDDLCDGKGFRFEVKFKRGSEELADDEIYSLFKLTAPITENLTVISADGMPKVYSDAKDLIKDFCDFRMPVLQDRIDSNVRNLEEDSRYKKVKIYFIMAVLEGKIVFKNKKKAEVSEQIMKNVKNVLDTDVDSLLRLSLLTLTEESVQNLADEVLEIKKELDYWRGTTPKEQFMKDLDQI